MGEKMRLKLVVIFSLLLLEILALFFFGLGATACFTRGADLILTVEFVIYIVCAVVLFLLTTYLLWKFNSKEAIIIIVIMNIIFDSFVVIKTNRKGWIDDIVFEDNKQITQNKKYEYDLELVNWFQTNGKIRLHIKDILYGSDSYIDLAMNIDTERGYGRAYVAWANLIATNTKNIYYLETTKEFSNQFDVPIQKFKIDLENNASRKLE